GTQLASARGLAADDKQVSGEPQQRRRALDGARGPEEALALDGIGPSRLEIGQEPARALDADEVERLESRLAHLGFELVRQVEVRSGEVVPLGRVRVAAVVQVALDDRDERRVTAESLEHAGEERGEARDAGREDEPAGLEHPTRLDERRRSEEHTSELQSRGQLVCRHLLENKKITERRTPIY